MPEIKTTLEIDFTKKALQKKHTKSEASTKKNTSCSKK